MGTPSQQVPDLLDKFSISSSWTSHHQSRQLATCKRGPDWNVPLKYTRKQMKKYPWNIIYGAYGVCIYIYDICIYSLIYRCGAYLYIICDIYIYMWVCDIYIYVIYIYIYVWYIYIYMWYIYMWYIYIYMWYIYMYDDIYILKCISTELY